MAARAIHPDRGPGHGSLLSPVSLVLCISLLACATAGDESPSDRGGVVSGPPAASLQGHERMVTLLREIVRQTPDHNVWLGDRDARVKRQRHASLGEGATPHERWQSHLEVGLAELRLGHETRAIEHLESAYQLLPSVTDMEPGWDDITRFELGLAHMRRGETQNCAIRHNADSCILPLRPGALHTDETGSRQAIRFFTEVLNGESANLAMHLKSLWLLNLAYMTVGGFPADVPSEYRISPATFESRVSFPRFQNVAPAAGLNSFNLYGGAVVDDLDNDGLLDIFTTTFDIQDHPHLFWNRGAEGFADRSVEAGLVDLYGGINVVQADYDNDGFLDLYVLRGAWMAAEGRHPNSLLRNNGDGTFTDVTFDAGLGQEHWPTQTGAWADFNNDGHIDLYVGNESSASIRAPSQLFRNNGDGTFTDVAVEAGVENLRFVKGVVWGDYDNDRWPDLYTSVEGGANRLYRNNGLGDDGQVTFTDVALELGVAGPTQSFPVWFWDFDNDGVLDLYVPSYSGDKESVAQVAASYLGLEITMELPRLYRGNGRGGFDEVAEATGLTLLTLPMGANFGDLDNDGYLDMYLGTGYPDNEGLMPNVMYRNRGGRRFDDVTFAGGFGHLQKGHSISFADLDNDGDQDIFEQMGGIYPGDRFSNALFENPGFGNHWIAVQLQGVQSNRAAIGARIRVDIVEQGERRSIFKHVNSGGSFGANPLRQTIGLGRATEIVELEVYWPTSDLTQSFTDIAMDQFVRIVEGSDAPKSIELSPFPF